MYRKRCAWCGDPAYGTALEWFWDRYYYEWTYDVYPSCGDWCCGEDFIAYYDLY